MYKKFNLLSDKTSNNFFKDISEKDIENYISKMEKLEEELIKQFENRGSLPLLENNSIDGTSVINKWFPNYDADIFLSHSHNDINLALKTACWLEKSFGLNVFIDSLLWGSIDDLLLKIDKRYTYNTETNTYNYKLRNFTTGHVHMMLSTALNDMIDSTECIIFLNTPQSIELSKVGESTYSPWIYSEIKAANILRINTPSRFAQIRHGGGNYQTREAMNEMPQIKYQTDLSKFNKIAYSALGGWKLLNGKTRGKTSLDTLYLGWGKH